MYNMQWYNIGWLRLGRNGWGIAWKNIKYHKLLFSERNGYTKHLCIGHYSVKLLKPRKSIKPCDKHSTPSV